MINRRERSLPRPWQSERVTARKHAQNILHNKGDSLVDCSSQHVAKMNRMARRDTQIHNYRWRLQHSSLSNWCFKQAENQFGYVQAPFDFHGSPGVQNLPVNAQDTGSIRGPGRFHMQRGSWAQALQLLCPWAPEPMLCVRAATTRRRRSQPKKKKKQKNRVNPNSSINQLDLTDTEFFIQNNRPHILLHVTWNIYTPI